MSQKRKHVALLTGGESHEREVALWSAEFVSGVLKPVFDLEVFDYPAQKKEVIGRASEWDAVIPMFHGSGGEDGRYQRELSEYGIKSIFSDPDVHALALDKSKTKAHLRTLPVCMPEEVVLQRGDAYTYISPVVIKPMHGGSTIGVTIAQSEEQCVQGLKQAFSVEDTVLVEEYISGREFTVPIVEVDGVARALAVGEIISPNGLFGFEEKYIEGKMAQEVFPADIHPSIASRLQAAALGAHTTIGARHITRSDFLLDSSGEIWFLEINTIPGLTKQSLTPKAVKEAGLDLASLFVRWVDSLK